MTAGRVLLLRHGQTAWNATGRFQGQADVELDEVGRAQAEQAAVALAGEGITAIHSSDLGRTRQTVAAVERRTGLTATLDPRFREISVGSWEGLTLTEVQAEEPQYLQREAAGEDVRRSAAGESLGEVATRFATALTDVTAAAAASDVLLVCTHGLAARVGTAAFLGLDLVAARRFSGIRNCHWISLGHVHGSWRIEAYNVGAGPDALVGLVG